MPFKGYLAGLEWDWNLFKLCDSRLQRICNHHALMTLKKKVNILCSWLRKLNVIKIMFHKTNIISVNIQVVFFFFWSFLMVSRVEFDEAMIHFLRSYRYVKDSQNICELKEQWGNGKVGQ